MSGYWIGVAAANHIARGREGGFMQLNHAKSAPLKRIKGGDIIAYYSPVTVFGGTEKLRAFTAIGRVKEGESYQGDMGGGFKPFVLPVARIPASDALNPLAPAAFSARTQ